MTIWEYLIGAVIILFALIVIVAILLQESKQNNMGVISGGSSESFMDKGNNRTREASLAFWTKVTAIAFFVLVLAGMFVTKFLGA